LRSICFFYRYENEYQNLLGLPKTEDDPSDTMKLKKPSQECFNCLATNHKITECPIKQDQERIQLNRKNFASQSLASNEQAALFSNRYTAEDKNKLNRGFTPGKISDDLREALGLNKKQLPPYIYIMRELGYPIAWLKEAVVRKSGINVIDGKDISDVTDNIGKFSKRKINFRVSKREIIGFVSNWLNFIHKLVLVSS
jgi:zinc finger CCHC domain-containing protein 8